MALPTPALPSSSQNQSQSGVSIVRPPSPGEYLDGVCLSAGGLRAIRALQGDGNATFNALYGKKKRKPRFDGPFDKNIGNNLYWF